MPTARSLATHVAGNVWKVPVVAAQAVRAGDPLVIVESMKMEVGGVAPCDGTVVQVLCHEGGQVAAGQRVVAVAAAG